MLVSETDRKIFQDYLASGLATHSDEVAFDSDQKLKVNQALTKIREHAKNHKSLHIFMQALPFLILGLIWCGVVFGLPALVTDQIWLMVLLGVSHGVWGYQWVIYSMHEGAGHGLFSRRATRFEKCLNWLAFHSCRLQFADPEFYHSVHHRHHRHLGTYQDPVMVNYVSPRKILISLLPGAGILFPNSYCVHRPQKMTRSFLISNLVGGMFLATEVACLTPHLEIWQSLLALALIGPWAGMFLDRTRESFEHALMPAHGQYGAIELGLGPLALLIGGGPWGQPCHFAHHFAPDLNWYQQIEFHLKLKRILWPHQKKIFGFSDGTVVGLLLRKLRLRMAFETAREVL